MNTVYWKITRDLIARGEWPSDTGTSRGTREQAEQAGLSIIPVRLLDDDREVYYHAEAADNDSLESLLSFAMQNAGCTILQDKFDGEWRDVIS